MAETITITLAARDAAPWLTEMLDSVLAQTDHDWQLLVLDDGSRDATPAVVGDYAARESRIRVLERHEDARGVPTSLNRLLGEVATPLLARADADDVWEPGRLAAQRRALERAPGLAGVTCRVAPFPPTAMGDGMRRYFDWQNTLLTPEEIARDRFVESTIAHPTLMLRTDVLRGLGGWNDPPWPEDWDLHLRLLEAGHRIERIDDVLYRWRMHTGQLTQADSRYSEDSFLAARAHYLARFIASNRGDRPVQLLGAGPVGKRLARALALEHCVIDGFVDVDPKKIGGIVHAGAHRWPVASMDTLFAVEPRPLAISTVGLVGGRSRVRGLLTDRGWIEGRDFVVAA